MVVWIIGLSGSGKTTLAETVVSLLRDKGRKVILLDGDRVRDLYGNDLGHGLDDRFKNAERICHLCGFLDAQGLDVVCAFLSIFPESRNWCRKQLCDYYEVFIDAPLETLKQRDSKGLYTRYTKGEITNVAGLDLEFPRPSSAELVIRNDASLKHLLSYAPIIVDQILAGKN